MDGKKEFDEFDDFSNKKTTLKLDLDLEEAGDLVHAVGNYLKDVKHKEDELRVLYRKVNKLHKQLLQCDSRFNL